MTQITGQLNDSVGNPIDGTLTVSLPFSILFGNSVHTQIEEEYVITGGLLDIDLPSTDENEAVYNFRFENENGLLFEFKSGVPANINGVDFANLFPTGITATNLDTSTFALAKRITGDPTLSEQFKQVAVFTKEFEGQSILSLSRHPKPFEGALKILSLTVLGTENSDEWVFETGFINNDGSETLISPNNTSDDAAGFRYLQHLYTNQTSSSTVKGFFLKATPNSGAGALTASVSISYLEV